MPESTPPSRHESVARTSRSACPLTFFALHPEFRCRRAPRPRPILFSCRLTLHKTLLRFSFNPFELQISCICHTSRPPSPLVAESLERPRATEGFVPTRATVGVAPLDGTAQNNEFVQDVIRDDRANMLRGQLEAKFGNLPKWVDERLEAATSVQVERWSKKILTADTLEGVLGKK